MNKFYWVIPGIALAVFVAFQQPAERALLKKSQAHAAQAAARREEADQREAELKRRAQQEMAQRAEERAQQERERTEKKQREFAAALEKIEDEAGLHLEAARALREDIAALEAEISAVRTKKTRRIVKRSSSRRRSSSIASRAAMPSSRSNAPRGWWP